MIYELGLISVVVGAGYWGWFFVRQRPHGTATFGVMQLAAAALALLGFLGRRLDVAWLGIPGAVGLGAGLCLLVIGPRVRALARRMVAAERMTLATRLLDLAELLAPGSGVAEEKAMVRAMADIRAGRVEQTVEVLTAARERAPGPDAQRAIDEQITMLYLTAHRWRDATAYAESHLLGAPSAGGEDGDGSLRRALGVAAPVWVDLLGAYGRTGDLDQAARMLVRLEDACTGRDGAAVWLHRGRMMFLALAGRPDAVRALVAPRAARHMSRAARGYWLAVAHERRGDRDTAASIYAQARMASYGRPHAMIEQAIAGLADARPVELSPAAREVVDRVEAAPPPQIRIARAPVRATWLVAAVLVAVSAITASAVGDTADVGVLLRAGALVHGVVASGEWWRLITCVFVHVGVIHLGLNVLGLLVLGAVAEDVFGRAGLVAIFGGAGIAGAAASYLASRGMLSAGASGAVFGLLGAVFVEITLHRPRYRMAWKRGMWGALVVIAVGELGYGVLTPAMDQWAHGAGLAAGALLGIALSPTARWVRVGAAAGTALAIAFVAAAVVAGILVVRTSCLDSLARGGLAPARVGDLVIRVPAGWGSSPGRPASDGPPAPLDGAVYEVHEPDGLVVVELAHRRGGDLSRQLALWLAEQGRRVKDELRDDDAAGDDTGELIDAGVTPLIALPAGWDGRELIVVAPDDGMGNRQRLRLVVCGRVSGDGSVLAAIVVPETIAAAAPGFFAQLLASIEA